MQNLKALKFKPFSINEVIPSGWLKRQLRIQADGMTGHLDEFWPDIKDSSWFGGNAEGWERAPYWLDGLMPLAYLLDDSDLIIKVEKYMDYIIEHQHEDGWLGPKDSNVVNPEAKDRYDIWAQFLALKVLVQYYEIKNDERIITAVEKGLRKVDSVIDYTPLFDWGQARWFEAVISIFWLYEKKPEKWLMDLVTKLEAQGFGWQSFFKNWPMKDVTPKEKWNFMSHIVNNAMAVKAYGLMSRIDENNVVVALNKVQEQKLVGRDGLVAPKTSEAACRYPVPQDKEKDEYQKTVDSMINQLEKYHGTAVGTFTGDECLAGAEPTRGTELCAIVEYMYSLEHLIQIFGDVKYSDRLEKIAFNALPGSFTRDMWAHQYDEQTNQIEASENEAMPWNTNGPDANTFGLEPHFGCCTSNYHQGWPKFAASLWSRTENGIALNSYAPSELKTSINEISAKIKLITDYPFKNKLNFVIESEQENEFSLFLRIPEWCKKAQLNIDDKEIEISSSGSYYELRRGWGTKNEFSLVLESDIILAKRYNNAVSVNYGPLVYSLKIDEERKIIHQDKTYREYPHCDYEMHAASAWNFAINEKSSTKIIEKNIDSEFPFSDRNFPVTIKIKAKECEQWKKKICIADVVPESPVKLNDIPEKEIMLVPFGCTHLRITEFPWYK